MKLKIFIHSIHIVNKVRTIIKRNKISKSNYSNIVIYYSNFINEIELSLEMFYEHFSKDNKSKLYFPLFLCELIKLGFKFKEFNNLRNLGYEFYLDEKIFYENILEINEDEYLEKIYNNNFLKESKELSIKPTKSFFYIPVIEQNKQNTIFYRFEDKNNKLKNKIIPSLTLNQMGEIIYLLKPIIRLTVLSYFKNNDIICLFTNFILDGIIFLWKIDITSFTFRKKKAYYLENRFRKKNLFFYALREPIYSKVVKPLILKIFNIIHLPNLLCSIINDILEYHKLFTLII